MLNGDLITVFKYLKCCHIEKGLELFHAVPQDKYLVILRSQSLAKIKWGFSTIRADLNRGNYITKY